MILAHRVLLGTFVGLWLEEPCWLLATLYVIPIMSCVHCILHYSHRLMTLFLHQLYFVGIEHPGEVFPYLILFMNLWCIALAVIRLCTLFLQKTINILKVKSTKRHPLDWTCVVGVLGSVSVAGSLCTSKGDLGIFWADPSGNSATPALLFGSCSAVMLHLLMYRLEEAFTHLYIN